MEFPFTCTIKPYISTDVDHNKTYGTSFTSPCNIQQVNELVVTANGKESISTAWVAIPPETPIKKEDQIILPDRSSPYVRSFNQNYRSSDWEIEYITLNLSKPTTRGDS